jgi:hypothetical protein
MSDRAGMPDNYDLDLSREAESDEALSDRWCATHPPIDGDDRTPLEVLNAGLISRSEFLALVEEPGDRERQAVTDEARQDQAAMDREYAEEAAETGDIPPYPYMAGELWRSMAANEHGGPSPLELAEAAETEPVTWISGSLTEWARQNERDAGPTEDQIISWGEHNAHADGYDAEADR